MEKEGCTPEFIRKWRQGFGEILVSINLVIDELSQDPPKWRDTLLNNESSSIEISKDIKTIFPTKYHTSNININVDINVKDTKLISCINSLQNVEPPTK